MFWKLLLMDMTGMFLMKICKKETCYLLAENLASYRRGRKGSISSHNYKSLIKWHYRLYRTAEKQNRFLAAFNTVRNLVFGLWKKIYYVKRIEKSI